MKEMNRKVLAEKLVGIASAMIEVEERGGMEAPLSKEAVLRDVREKLCDVFDTQHTQHRLSVRVGISYECHGVLNLFRKELIFQAVSEFLISGSRHQGLVFGRIRWFDLDQPAAFKGRFIDR